MKIDLDLLYIFLNFELKLHSNSIVSSCYLFLKSQGTCLAVTWNPFLYILKPTIHGSSTVFLLMPVSLPCFFTRERKRDWERKIGGERERERESTYSSPSERYVREWERERERKREREKERKRERERERERRKRESPSLPQSVSAFSSVNHERRNEREGKKKSENEEKITFSAADKGGSFFSLLWQNLTLTLNWPEGAEWSREGGCETTPRSALDFRVGRSKDWEGKSDWTVIFYNMRFLYKRNWGNRQGKLGFFSGDLHLT